MTASKRPRAGRRTRGRRVSVARKKRGTTRSGRPPRRRRKLTRAQQAKRTELRTRWMLIGAATTIAALIVVSVAFALRPAQLPDVPSVRVNPSAVPEMSVAGYDHEQLVNAAVIIDVGNSLGLDPRDQAIAVMTAMGESSLRNIDYGDWETSGERNPDGTSTSSVGLFQQQDWWGTYDERMDPRTSAQLFFRAMMRGSSATEREAEAPSLVAHGIQINDDPEHYAPYWDAAVAVVAALAASDAAR